ncbi:MAG: hypothetical protein OEW56_08895 [Gemmatimonadota bacterium]|nr:hypothetical protein [Gemmatimonadota bacterium]
MMPKSWTPLALAALAVAALGCGSDANGPDPGPDPANTRVRTLLVHHQDTGENTLVNTDGSAAGTFADASRGMVPIGIDPADGTAVLIDGTVITLVTLGKPDQIDTIIQPAPASLSLAAFSPNGVLVALVSYAPTAALLLYDRANRRVDTLSLAGADPVLPPAFSPDGERIALITLTDISILATVIPLDPLASAQTRRLAVSRFTNRLIFGWPRWGSDGLQIAVRRVAQEGPDTLLVGVVDPDIEGTLLTEQYRALLAPAAHPTAELDFAVESTYHLASDGQALALGAVPGTGGARHAVYLVTPGISRVQPVLDTLAQYPVFPLFIRE